ncbi:GAF domain-containing protein [Eubacteriaceae bacterium ES2]|nr:GAF domain-containing protein [Eubacteriaceae bacterium ES2]
MSLKMSGLLDIEKYLLLELVYYHLPAPYPKNITRESALMLDQYIDLIGQCKNAMVPELIGASKRISSLMKKRQAHFQRVFAMSENLADLRVTAYINDNYGQLGNSEDVAKTSLVAIALEDSEGNGAVVYSGCESQQLSGMVLDWGGCLLASLGIDTRHHHKARAFYDRAMKGVSGERNLFGHSKGGNLATYVFVNRLSENTNAYCVNAQPYCWSVMDEDQKKALKSERYEYIVHQNDPTRNSGYVSYVSRIAPLNRYGGKGLLDIHNFSGVSFDSYGNLEGTRVVRETKSALQARLFHDFSTEKPWSHDECLARFFEKTKEIKSLPRLFSITLDELLLVTKAQAAVIWLRESDHQGTFIYPLIIRSGSNVDFYQLKLREGDGIATRSVFEGLPMLIRNPDQMAIRKIRQMTGLPINSIIAVPLGLDEKEVFGALELINKTEGVFSLEDFALVNEMTLLMLDLFKNSGEPIEIFRDFSLLQLKKHGQRLFSTERFSYTEKFFQNEADKRLFYEKIIGKRLETDERLIFNRQSFTPELKAPLKRLYDQEFAELFGSEHFLKTKVNTHLLKSLRGLDKKNYNLIWLARLFGLEHQLEWRIGQLDEKKIILMEYGLARLKNPKIIFLNQPTFINSRVFDILCRHLKELTRSKVMTVVVMRLEKHE